MPPTIVHFTTDTLPRVIAERGGSTLDLVVPFRIDLDPAAGQAVTSWHLDLVVDGQPWSTRGRVHRLRPKRAESLRERMQRTGRFSFEHLPYYVELDDGAMAEKRAVYLEGRAPRLRPGARVRYALRATVRDRAGAEQVLTSPSFVTYAVDPRFGRDDIRRIYIPAPGRAEDAWVLHHRRSAGLDQIRLDVLNLREDGTAPERAHLTLAIGGSTLDLPTIDPAATAAPGAVALPLVDIAADSVTCAVSHDDGELPPVVVRYRGNDVTVDLSRRENVGETRLMFVNFAIQGLNDLFASPDDDYEPPRTYTQVTMRDEAASYSSRPGSGERHTGDGYAFTLDAHRRYRVPQMWAMNGGLLGLLAHDSPDDLDAMKADVDDGLLVPVNAGYGAHRLPYYTAATNLDAITFGNTVTEELLGRSSDAYYPDSRITTDRPNVVDALRTAGVEYLVVDAGPGEGADAHTSGNTIVAKADPPMGEETDKRWVNWQYLWRDRVTGAKVLFIDPELKDKLLVSGEVSPDRGTVHRDLRRKFLELASQPQLRARNLVVYSDDADKASGNGWFDGFYEGAELQYNQSYQAALSWVSSHPWVRVVTTADLTDNDCAGELDLVRASDPKIENEWRLTHFEPVPPADPDFDLAFDTWYVAWSKTRAAWLGETLRAVSDRAEKAIARRRAGGRDDELVRLARLYFTMCLHESQWSKRPRIDPNHDPERIDDVEDFVVAESLQLRNAHVYLNASFWAQWAARVAAGTEQPGAHRDAGPVVDDVAEFEEAGFGEEPDGSAPAWWRPDERGRQWDHDPLASVVLYNEHVLVVIDRNGGRITHLFAMVDGRPCSVSGTHKAYQFLDLEWRADSGTECDGIVLQNTVWTPNHGYVACDVDASRGTVGVSPSGDAVFDWYYPDNFNLYDEVDDASPGPAVTFEYGPGSHDGEPPATIAELEGALEADHAEKVAGRRGTVFHDVAEFGTFRKTIRLDGRTVHVDYRNTVPGHRVANEFCVDLEAAALRGGRQRPVADPNGTSATITNDAGLAVRIDLLQGCEFSEATRAPLVPPTAESLRLHRVMTDDLEIVAPEGGDFAYRITLP